MIPWIQVYSNILTHDKTYKLAESLKIPNYSAVGLMVSLWCWVAVNAPDGDITSYPPRAITAATGWPKKPETFYAALVDAELIEKREDGRAVIRNWEQYATLLMDLMDSQKKKTAERVKKHRARRKAREDAGSDPAPDQTPETDATGEALPVTPDVEEVKRDCNVTETESNALHNITGHNPTLPNHSPYGEYNNSFVVDDGAQARAEQIGTEFIKQRDLCISAYFGATATVQAEARSVADSIYKAFGLRAPTEQDVLMVFRYSTHRECNESGWVITFPEERIKLLMYAFEQAGKAGCPGNWNYIEGCMARLHQRGIKTLEAAEDYDLEREGGI